MNKKQSITLVLSTVLLVSMMGIALLPSAMASGKSVYGTLYIDGSIAASGIQITMTVNDVVLQTNTVTWDDDNFIFGFNSSLEGSVAVFSVDGYDLDQSLYIGSWIGYQLNLYATTPPESGEEPVDDGGGGSSGGGGGTWT